MHVLHIIDSLSIGGAERMLVDLANATVRDGHRVSVCVTRTTSTLAKELDPRIETFVLGRTSRISVRKSVELARWIRSQGPDVLHVHMRSSLAYVLLLRATRMIRTPIVAHDHFGSIEIDRSVPRWFRASRRLIGHYVGVSDALRDWARAAGVPADKTTTIGNGLDLARLSAERNTRLRDELGVAPDVLLGVLVASFKREKGIDRMIEAVARARSRDRIVVAVLGAETDAAFAAECRAKLREAGLEQTIRFLGARGEVPALLAGADFAILSSRSESGPLVLIEYLAARLPIVATRVGDIGHKIAAAGVEGFVPADDPEAMARALDTLVAATAAERAGRAARGNDVLGASWDIRASLPAWYEIYDSVIIARR